MHMRVVRRMYRLVVVLALAIPVAGTAVQATAAAGSHQGTPAAIALAAARPAPLVTDLQPKVRTKRGMAAPDMSATMQGANTRRQASALALLQLMAGRMGPDQKCTTLACRAGLPAARDLGATQQAQVRNYYCGPATVSEMLAQVGVKLGQYATARELDTNVNGTDWSDGSGYPVPRVLNRNQARNDYVAVALPWSPSARQISTYEVDLVADVNSNGGVPLAGNGYEVAGGPHLVGNPVNQTIMHWIDIRGYQKYGTITDYEDSVHGASSIGWGLSVPAYSSMSSVALVDILGARGYDW
jgi:hypothetical protein